QHRARREARRGTARRRRPPDLDHHGARPMTTPPTSRAATARAFPNLALVKYWGKRDEELSLPVAGSLSLTLDAFPTTTTVTVDPSMDRDTFELNGATATGTAADRVTAFLDLVRDCAGATGHARARPVNEAGRKSV